MTDEGAEPKPAEPGQVVALATDWPGQKLPLMPGDFSKYVPQGLGLAAPLVVRPWDDPLRVLSGPNFYGFDARETDPIRAAPTQEPCGGVVYFDDYVKDDAVRAVLFATGVHKARRDFAVFVADASDPPRQRFLTQARIMSRAALGYLFGAGERAEQLADQPLSIEEYVLAFLREQRARWAVSSELSGTLGGDGDWAKESLAFGFLVENSYWAVYRVWSRPWLVTK